MIFPIIKGESCLIEDLGTGNGTRYWYTCNDVNGLNVTTHYVGNKMTDPEYIPYWFYTHFGLNILWIVTILLLLTPTDGSNDKGIPSRFKSIKTEGEFSNLCLSTEIFV